MGSGTYQPSYFKLYLFDRGIASNLLHETQSSKAQLGTYSRHTHLPKMDCPRKAAGGHGMGWDLVARFDFAKSHRRSTRSSRWEAAFISNDSV